MWVGGGRSGGNIQIVEKHKKESSRNVEKTKTRKQSKKFAFLRSRGLFVLGSGFLEKFKFWNKPKS